MSKWQKKLKNKDKVIIKIKPRGGGKTTKFNGDFRGAFYGKLCNTKIMGTHPEAIYIDDKAKSHITPKKLEFYEWLKYTGVLDRIGWGPQDSPQKQESGAAIANEDICWNCGCKYPIDNIDDDYCEKCGKSKIFEGI